MLNGNFQRLVHELTNDDFYDPKSWIASASFVKLFFSRLDLKGKKQNQQIKLIVITY